MTFPSRGLARGRAAIALLLLTACRVLGAAEAAPARAAFVPPTKLSAAQAVTAALGQKADLKEAEADRLSSLSRLRIANIGATFDVGAYAGTERDPSGSTASASATGGLSYKGLEGTEASISLSPLGIGNLESGLGISLRKPLIRGKGWLSDKSDIVLGARSDATVAEKRLYLIRQSTALGVVEAYYQAVLDRERVKVRERALSIAQEVADGARKRAAEGLVAEIEVSRADLRVARTRDQLNLQSQAARAAMDRLMLAIGAGVGHSPELTDGIPEAEALTGFGISASLKSRNNDNDNDVGHNPELTDGIPEAETSTGFGISASLKSRNTEVASLGEAVEEALRNRCELNISDEQLSEKARELARVNDTLRPGLDVVAGFNTIDSYGGLYSGSLFGGSNMTVGMELVLPLDKRISREEREIASRELDTLRILKNYQMEQIAEQVRRAHRSLEAARASLDILSRNSKVAEENLSLAQRMVEEGLVSNRETLEAQDSLTEVENGLLAAKTNVYLANLSLRYAMGEDLTTVVAK